MARITLEYDARNAIAKKALDFLLSLGAFKKVESKNTMEILDQKELNKETIQAIEDVENGKTFKVKNSAQLFEELGI